MKRKKRDHAIGLELLAAKGIVPGKKRWIREQFEPSRTLCPSRPSRGRKL
jgi:hypothetical protein